MGKIVLNGKEYTGGSSGGGGNVDDVKVNGTSVVDANKVANITDFTGASTSSNGTAGLVPSPLSSEANKFLSGDGRWKQLIIKQADIKLETIYRSTSTSLSNYSHTCTKTGSYIIQLLGSGETLSRNISCSGTLVNKYDDVSSGAIFYEAVFSCTAGDTITASYNVQLSSTPGARFNIYYINAEVTSVITQKIGWDQTLSYSYSLNGEEVVLCTMASYGINSNSQNIPTPEVGYATYSIGNTCCAAVIVGEDASFSCSNTTYMWGRNMIFAYSIRYEYEVVGEYYSEEEQIIGTWIDGKPIYKRTWDLGSDVTVGEWTTVMSVTGLNIDKIINSISVQNDSAISMIEYWVDGNTLKGNTLRNYGGDDYVRYLTLQYTKTTD